MRCAICLSGNISYKMCCNLHVHKKCQKKWGKNCIICKKPVKQIKTTERYQYEPPEPEMTREELQEQMAIMQEIQNRRTVFREEIDSLQGSSTNPSRLSTVRMLTSFFENLL